MRKEFYIDKYKEQNIPLRTHYIMNHGLMEFSINKLKKELEKVDEVVTLEAAVDWLAASEMFTGEEIQDFIDNFEEKNQ